MGTYNGTATLGNSLAIPQNSKDRDTTDSAILLLGIYSREIKMYVHTKPHTRVYITVLLIIAKKYKQFKCQSADKQLKRMLSIHTMKYYLNLKTKLLIYTTA